MYEKQVSKEHYGFSGYLGKHRWASVWHQLDELMRLSPRSTLEIGPGPGVFKAVAALFGINVVTLDIDSELRPDYVGSATAMPFDNGSFEVTACFQMLEHMQYEDALKALKEVRRVTTRRLILSLPDARRSVGMGFRLPGFGFKMAMLNIPEIRLRRHVFDGQHYWEVNKRGYSQKKFVADVEALGLKLYRSYRVPEVPYHRFFVFNVSNGDESEKSI